MKYRKRFFVVFVMVLFLLTLSSVCFAEGSHCNNRLCEYNCTCCDKYNAKGCAHCGAYCGNDYSYHVGFGTFGYYPIYRRPIYHDDREDFDIHDIDIHDIDIEHIHDVFEEGLPDFDGGFDGGDF